MCNPKYGRGQAHLTAEVDFAGCQLAVNSAVVN